MRARNWGLYINIVYNNNNMHKVWIVNFVIGNTDTFMQENECYNFVSCSRVDCQEYNGTL